MFALKDSQSLLLVLSDFCSFGDVQRKILRSLTRKADLLWVSQELRRTNCRLGGGSDRLIGQLATGSLRRIRSMPDRISPRTTAGDGPWQDLSVVFIVFTHVKQETTAKPAINTEKIVLPFAVRLSRLRTDQRAGGAMRAEQGKQAEATDAEDARTGPAPSLFESGASQIT